MHICLLFSLPGLKCTKNVLNRGFLCTFKPQAQTQTIK